MAVGQGVSLTEAQTHVPYPHTHTHIDRGEAQLVLATIHKHAHTHTYIHTLQGVRDETTGYYLDFVVSGEGRTGMTLQLDGGEGGCVHVCICACRLRRTGTTVQLDGADVFVCVRARAHACVCVRTQRSLEPGQKRSCRAYAT